MRIFQGKFVYDNLQELTYAFLNTMEMSTRPDGTIIDKSINPAGVEIRVSDKVLKANTDVRNIHYAGEQDVILDPITNYHILNILFGLYIDKYQMNENREMVSMYTEEKLDEDKEKMFAYGIKFSDGETFLSEYYYSRCIGLIELIFILSEENVYLRNFDLTPTEMELLRRKRAKEAEAKKKKPFTLVLEDPKEDKHV